MKKVLLSLIIMISIGISIHAQDEAVYSQYIFHPILVNPAYAGFKQQHELIFNFKNAYASFPGSPKTYTLSFDGPVAPKLGFVGQIYNDIAGDLSKFKAQAGLAYLFDMGSVKMNAGLAAQFYRMQLANGAVLDPLVVSPVPLLQAAADGLNFFSTTLGIYFLETLHVQIFEKLNINFQLFHLHPFINGYINAFVIFTFCLTIILLLQKIKILKKFVS